MKLTNKIKWTFLVLALATTVSLMGCSSSAQPSEAADSSGPVSLRFIWWGSDQRKESTQKVIDLYESKHPDVKIEAVPVSDTTATQTQWAIENAEQQAADIIQADYSFIFNFSDRNLVEPLNTWIDQKVIDVSAIDPTTLAPGKKGENLYAFPISQNNQLFLYNAQMFEDAGIQVPQGSYSLDEFERMLQTLKEKHPEEGFAPLANMIDVNYYLRSQGVHMYNEAGSALGYTDDQILADYFALNKKWRDQGYILEKASTKLDENHPIVSKKAAILSFSSNNIVGLSKLSGSPVHLMRFPTVGDKDGHWVKPSMFLAISSYSPHKKEAAEFLNFFINDPEANDILNAERGVPVSATISDRLAANDDQVAEQVRFLEDVKKTAEPLDPPNPSSQVVVSSIYQVILDQVLAGTITPEKGAADYRAQAEEIMASSLEGTQS